KGLQYFNGTIGAPIIHNNEFVEISSVVSNKCFDNINFIFYPTNSYEFHDDELETQQMTIESWICAFTKQSCKIGSKWLQRVNAYHKLFWVLDERHSWFPAQPSIIKRFYLMIPDRQEDHLLSHHHGNQTAV